MKYLVATFSIGLILLSFAVKSFALQAEIPTDTKAVIAKKDPQITIGGEIRLSGWHINNAGDILTSENKTLQKEQPDRQSKQTYDTQIGK